VTVISAGYGDRAALRLAVLDDWESAASDFVDWRTAIPEADVTLFTDHLSGIDELVERLAPFDAVMLMRERTPIQAPLIKALPKLRLIVTTGMRNRSLDIAAAAEAGVVVCGTRGLQWAAPELAWSLILALARNIPAADASMHAGRWAPTVGMDLHGSVLGVVGLGRLGEQVATVGRAFGMKLVAWSPHLTAERAAACGAEQVGKHELFATADVVSVHMILADSTRGLIGAAEIGAMKTTALFVNTSRGPLVDTDALLSALIEGRIAGAGLDVYDEEPLSVDHRLRSAPRTILTPHLGYVTAGTFASFYSEATEDVRAFLAGRPVRVINP
jgi:phosphoglycerate dehydrogenase-like enzyme